MNYFLFSVFFLCVSCYSFPKKSPHSFEEKQGPRAYQIIKDQAPIEVATPRLQQQKIEKGMLENGLQVYLVSDPFASQSAACFGLPVGSWNDDPNYPGMAHFVEHLVFINSDGYPKPNHYDKFITENGGQFNAYTGSSETVYTFAINHDQFLHALDIFSHMFRSPRFEPDHLAHELHAVDEEHQKNIHDDGFRFWMVKKAVSKSSHPHVNFSTGNQKTLSKLSSDEIKAWFDKHYTANGAVLTLYSNLPLNELREVAQNTFGLLKGGDERDDFYTTYGSPVKEEIKGSVVSVESLQDSNTLRIYWDVPPSFFDEQGNASFYGLRSILESKNRGSLCDILKNKGLIKNIMVDILSLRKDHYELFVSFELTDSGRKDCQAVLHDFFGALNLLKTRVVPPYIFEENGMISELGCRFPESKSPYGTALHHTQSLLDEPIDRYPSKNILNKDVSNETFQNLLVFLTPRSGVYFLMSQDALLAENDSEVERWCGARYQITPFSESELQEFEGASVESLAIYPPKNKFLTQSITLHDKQEVSDTLLARPIFNEPGARFFCLNSSAFSTPAIVYDLALYSSALDGSIKSKIFLDLFVTDLRDSLHDLVEIGQKAHLNVYFSPIAGKKLLINFSGLSGKSIPFLQECLDHALHRKISKEQFSRLVRDLEQIYTNAPDSNPLQKLVATCYTILETDEPLQDALLKELSTLEYEEYEQFNQMLFKQTYLEGVVGGNYTDEDRKSVIQSTLGYLQETPITKPKFVDNCLFQEEFKPFTISKKLDQSGDSAALVIYAGEYSATNKAIQLIFSTALYDDFFATIRTDEQIAYLAAASRLEVDNTLLYFLSAHSASCQGDQLLCRFHMFSDQYIKKFNQIFPESRFNKIKDNIIAQRKSPSIGIRAEAKKVRSFLEKEDYGFLTDETLDLAIANLDYDSFKEHVTTVFSRENQRRFSLVFYGKFDNRLSYQDITLKELKERSVRSTEPTLACETAAG